MGYITKRISNQKKPKKSWKTLKNILNENEDKSENKYLFDEPGNKITENQKIANEFMENPKKIFTPKISNNNREHYVREHWYENHGFNNRTRRGQ